MYSLPCLEIAKSMGYQSSIQLMKNLEFGQRYTYRVLQTIQLKLILLCVWAEPAILGSVKTALKFKFEMANTYTI